jgi:hypothetical protein
MRSDIMFTLLILSAVLVVSAAVVATSMPNPKLQPAEFPFQPSTNDPSADTMVGQAQIETVFNDYGWQSVTVDSLSDVEEILDCLEADKVETREVIAQGNASFCVRWR